MTRNFLLHTQPTMMVMVEFTEEDIRRMRLFSTLMNEEATMELRIDLLPKDFWYVDAPGAKLAQIFPEFPAFGEYMELDGDFEVFRNRAKLLLPQLPDRPNPGGHMSVTVRMALSFYKKRWSGRYSDVTLADSSYGNTREEGIYIPRYAARPLLGHITNT